MKQKIKITEEDILEALEKHYEKEFKISYSELQKRFKLLKTMVGDASKHPKKDFKYFISAPFGNYIKHKNAISVTGTWTLNPRGNRFLSVLKTLRWNASLQGWTNRLGLPNPGLSVGLISRSPTEVLSIAEIERGDFEKMFRLIPDSQSVELNLSCPNIGKSLPWDSSEVFARTKEKRKWCICKVSPTVTPEDLEFLITKLGFTQIHASNTLPTQFGGLSGQSLIPYTLDTIRLIKEEWPGVTVIAGGGVNDFSVMYKYLNEGADHIAIGSLCFNWFKMRKLLKEK